MMVRNLKFHAERQPFTGGMALHVGADQDGKLFVGTPLVMRDAEPGMVTRPVMTLTQTAAQQLMDELWNCGLRPSEGAGSAGQLAATERHLADMRTLTFAALKVPHG